jgi:spermidine synthase
MQLPQWFIEGYNGSALMIKIKNTIFDKKGLQHIQIFETEEFGKMLVLDGKIQLTERDEEMYHEMLVHVPLFSTDNPEKILIIGGGDGGSVREALKHDPSEILLIEIDRDVYEACRVHIGIDHGALNDERVSVLFEDGVNFVRETKERFDVTIVDGTDPNPISGTLISKEFYNCCRKISEIFATQSQSPFLQKDYFKEILNNAKKVFEFCSVYINYVPTYPFGLWSYVLASDSVITMNYEILKERWEERKIETRHYNPELHIASFALPVWMGRIIREV